MTDTPLRNTTDTLTSEEPTSQTPTTISNITTLLVGIDVGSTTGKIAVYDPETKQVLFRRYVRHHARQVECVKNLLLEVKEAFPNASLRAAFCGSGGAALADALGLPYVQEVVANALAVSEFYPTARLLLSLVDKTPRWYFSNTTLTRNVLPLPTCA